VIDVELLRKVGESVKKRGSVIGDNFSKTAPPAKDILMDPIA
jgi:hypothetical protein